MKKKKSILLIIFLIIISLTCFVVGFLFMKKGFVKENPNDYIKYGEKSEINYKVFLKKNNFFDEEYLGMNQVYITSLIDYLDIDFNYNLVFEKAQSGKYKYFISGVMSANTQNNTGNYWKKEYKLSKDFEESFDNLNVVNVFKNIQIDYQKYNDLLLEFKKEFGLTIDASFKVFLNVTTIVDSDLSEEALEKNSVMSISVPLTKATIEVPIGVNNVDGYGSLIENISSDDKMRIIYKYSGFGIFGIGLILVVYITLYFVRKGEDNYAYHHKIKKILKTYDGIIVNVKNLPTLNNLNVINVSSFSELLDAHSEVRMPISFCEKNDEAYFLLLNDSIAWFYCLKKDDVINEEK